MRLIVMRHGHALSPVEAGVKTDADRPLSATGREEVRKQAGRLLAKGLVPDLILASPLLRAQQTAAELKRVFKDRPRLETYEPLSNQITGADLLRGLVQDGPRPGLVMLVGHMPQLGELAGTVLGAPIGFDTAGTALLELDAGGRGRLDFIISPGDD